LKTINQAINEYYFSVRPKVDQGADQLSQPLIGITKTERTRIKT